MTAKKTQPNRIAGFFHGIDPATQNDFYTDIVHVLPVKPHNQVGIEASEFSWLPFLVGALRIRKMDPNDMVDLQVRMFNQFPPTFAVIDKSREEFLSAALVRKYGENRIIPLKFGNAGSTNTKFDLKQIGYSYINSGYQWPQTTVIERTQPRLAKLLRILKKEMKREITKYTSNDRITFDSPIGKHNDLVHGWEMSLKAVMLFQEERLGFQKKGLNNPLLVKQTSKKKNKRDDVEDQLFEGPVYDREMNSISALPEDNF